MEFVFDLDGTICFKGQPVSDKLLQCLKGLDDNGHHVIFASARPVRDILPVIDNQFHNHSLIGGNGSLISSRGKITHIVSFSDDHIKLIMNLINQHSATYLIDGDWDYAYTGPSNHPILNNVDTFKLARKVPIESLEKIVKILVLSACEVEKFEEKLNTLDIIINKHENENMIDISPRNIHKWSALQKIGLTEKQFIAFGNDSNDISMFQHALYSVRIGNHSELGKFATDTISMDGNFEQSIIEKINQFSIQFESENSLL